VIGGLAGGAAAPPPPANENIKGNEFGDWNIVQNNTNGNPYNSNVTITFNPNKKTVCCDEITFIQTVKMVDGTGANRNAAFGAAYGNRTTAAGWAVDRVAN